MSGKEKRKDEAKKGGGEQRGEKKVSGFKKQTKKGKLVTSKNDKGLNAPPKNKIFAHFFLLPTLRNK